MHENVQKITLGSIVLKAGSIAPPSANLIHYDFLKLHYISLSMTYISSTAVAGIASNSTVMYVTNKNQ